ncbi:methylenetetrahydrofolate reductase [Kocuria sp. M1R5S2]|uniref:methylenetetrahydrofolate reductase n=1 Tax=Kocuria rhizosphaerae TaxID=3376285 RepID=UPI003795B82D
MPLTAPAVTPAAAALLEGFSLEMTGRDVPVLEETAAAVPPGTRLNITYLGTEGAALRLDAARAARELGLVPVPHLAARRMRSRAELDEFLTALAGVGAAQELLLVGGDPGTPEGPFPDALSVIHTGLLAEHGVQSVAVAGYPGGHPGIDDDALWSALTGKTTALRRQGIEPAVTTQFGFDPAGVLRWLAEARDRGVDAPVRVGVPGPAGVRRLLGYARRFGISTSAGIVQKYGLSLTQLLGTAGPDRFLDAFAAGHDPAVHGPVRLHLYAFGGLAATAQWVRDARKSGVAR